MRWSIIRLIWLRELRDQLRDRRTMFMIAVLPVLLYPVLGMGLLNFISGFAEQKSIIGVERGPRNTSDFPERDKDAAEANPKLPRFTPLVLDGKLNLASADTTAPTYKLLLQKVQFQFLDARAAAAAIEEGEVDLFLSLPPHFYTSLESSRDTPYTPPTIKVQGKAADERYRRAMMRLTPLLEAWKTDLKNTRLRQLDLQPNADVPFVIDDPKATKTGTESLVDMMVRIFPFMLVMWSLAGALYPAVDLCAGEKERGTMETLLISPAGREEIVLGKFLTIWVFSGGTALLNLLSMGLTTMVFATHLPFGPLPVGALLWCLVLLLPLSAFFSAISLAVGAYARSSKEGQYYLMPLFLVTMPLMFLTLAPGVELSPFYSLVPVTGAALLMQKLMTTASLAQVPWLYFVPVLAPIVLYSVLALRWAIDQFQREEVLFREAERLDIVLWIKRLLREKEETPTTAQAFFLFGLLIGLNWLSLSFGRNVSLIAHTAIRLLAFVATPALLMALLLNTKPWQGLSLRWPRLREIGLGALLALLLLPPLAALTHLVYSRYPHLTKLLEDRQPLVQELRSLSEGRDLSNDQVLPFLLVLALLPALCEEIAFRGFILSGLLKRFRPRTAVVLSSFLFALFHMNVFQFLPTFFLGMVLGLLTIRSRSLVPAIMFHLLHNAALIGGIHLVGNLEEAPEFVKELWYPFMSVCLVVALAILWWLYRKPYVELERKERALENASRSV